MIPDTAFWHALADAADKATLPHFRSGGRTSNKASAGFDPVTEADRAAERAIRELIEQAFPDDAILGEEEAPTDGASGRRWVIDPIDGTRAFVAGIPTWMTLIGLEVDGVGVAGLASQPWTGERFLSTNGSTGLHRQGERIRLATRSTQPADAIVMTVDPFLFEGSGLRAFETMREQCRLVRYSSDAYAFCALAAGAVQVAFERDVQPYDVGALIPIVEGAGGVFTRWDGGRPEQGGNVVAAASAELHDWALSHLQPVSPSH